MKKFVIIPASEIDNIDFNQIKITNKNTLVFSIDKLLTFVKYYDTMPTSIQLIKNKSQEYTHEEFLNILNSSSWYVQNNIGE